jgi:type IV secretory pathway protease TraF
MAFRFFLLSVFILASTAQSEWVWGQDFTFPKRQMSVLLGHSMRGWVNHGDSLELWLDSTAKMPLNRGDFAILNKGGNPKIPILKKIVGLPGDSLYLGGADSCFLFINGSPVRGPSGAELKFPLKRKKLIISMLKRIKGVLPPALFWVTGSSPGTHDSSLFGPVHRSQIMGIAKPHVLP